MLVRRLLQLVVIPVVSMMLIIIGNLVSLVQASVNASISDTIGEWKSQVIDARVAASNHSVPLADIAVDKENYPHISGSSAFSGCCWRTVK